MFYIPQDLLIKLIAENSISLDIPADAEIRCVCYIPSQKTFAFTLDHKSFESIPEGELLPVTHCKSL